jgi:hypothetical protein
MVFALSSQVEAARKTIRCLNHLYQWIPEAVTVVMAPPPLRHTLKVRVYALTVEDRKPGLEFQACERK